MGDNADLHVLCLEDRPLLYVQFEIGVQLPGADGFVAEPADASQLLFYGAAYRIGPGMRPFKRMHAGEDAGGQHGGREARALLVGEVGDHDRPTRHDTRVVERANEFEAGKDAEHTVVAAASGLGIEMATDANRIGIEIRAGAGREHRAHLIDAKAQARLFAPAGEQRAPLAIGIGQRLAVVAAGDAGPDLGHRHQRGPQPGAIDPEIGTCWHRKLAAQLSKKSRLMTSLSQSTMAL